MREDTCASLFFQLAGVPQYHIVNRIKGHNYHHPEKRMNTKCGKDGHKTRKGELFQKYAKESEAAMLDFINKIQRSKDPLNPFKEAE